MDGSDEARFLIQMVVTFFKPAITTRRRYKR